jgi:hypothetical protein
VLQQSPPPTWYSAVPTMHQEILNFAEEHKKNTGAAPKHHLQFARNCSAALLPTVAQRMENVLRVQVVGTYAMTESMPIASNPRRGGERKLLSVGFSGGPEILVMRDPENNKNLEICAPGEEVRFRLFTQPLHMLHPNTTLASLARQGHICVRGENVTQGYEFHSHMTEDPNIKAITNEGFLCTGDKGYVDSDGHLVITGRFKEIINRGGEKISPLEVEDVLMKHDAIKNMICFSVPHKQYGEVVGAAVVLHECKTLELEYLRSFALKNGVRKQWLPETMVIMDDIPKGITGKPARIKLAEKLQLPEINVGDTVVCWAASVSPCITPASVFKPSTAQEPSSLRLRVAEPVGLDRESWLSALLGYLMPALVSEAAVILGLSQEDVSDEIPIKNLPFDSLSLNLFREKIHRAIGIQVPLGDLIEYTIASLAKSITSGGLPASSIDERHPVCHREEKETVDEGAPFDLLPMQQLYFVRLRLLRLFTQPLNMMHPNTTLASLAQQAGRSSDVPQKAWIEWETVMPELDKARFEAAVNELMIRHGALRTFALPSVQQQIEPPEKVGKFGLVIHNTVESETDKAVDEHRQALLSNFSQRSFQIEALQLGGGAFRRGRSTRRRPGRSLSSNSCGCCTRESPR